MKLLTFSILVLLSFLTYDVNAVEVNAGRVTVTIDVPETYLEYYESAEQFEKNIQAYVEQDLNNRVYYEVEKTKLNEAKQIISSLGK